MRLTTPLLVSALVLTACSWSTKPITNFEECAAAGNPVMESYPRQCRADNQTFVEVIDESSSSSNSSEPDVVMLSPKEGDVIISPVKISGKARGNWFFEGSLPIDITDTAGTIVGTGIGVVEGGWMTIDLVKFESEVTFTTTAKEGFIVIKKDNPSGLPENDASVKIPVKFQ